MLFKQDHVCSYRAQPIVSSLHPDRKIDNGFFKQANHGTYSNPSTQVGTQDKDFGAVSQRDLTRV